MSRNLVAFEHERRNYGSMVFTPQELVSASVEICNALHGAYTDARCRKHKVSGDISKVRYVSGLSAAAQKILQRVKAVTQKISGTNEVRAIMRYDTHGAVQHKEFRFS
eukprot:12423052-Karenia_brevis.AAC.1